MFRECGVWGVCTVMLPLFILDAFSSHCHSTALSFSVRSLRGVAANWPLPTCLQPPPLPPPVRPPPASQADDCGDVGEPGRVGLVPTTPRRRVAGTTMGVLLGGGGGVLTLRRPPPLLARQLRCVRQWPARGASAATVATTDGRTLERWHRQGLWAPAPRLRLCFYGCNCRENGFVGHHCVCQPWPPSRWRRDTWRRRLSPTPATPPPVDVHSGLLCRRPLPSPRAFSLPRYPTVAATPAGLTRRALRMRHRGPCPQPDRHLRASVRGAVARLRLHLSGDGGGGPSWQRKPAPRRAEGEKEGEAADCVRTVNLGHGGAPNVRTRCVRLRGLSWTGGGRPANGRRPFGACRGADPPVSAGVARQLLPGTGRGP